MHSHILEIVNGDGEFRGHAIVTNLTMTEGGSMSYKLVRTYKGGPILNDVTHALCEGWLEGYSACKKEYV